MSSGCTAAAAPVEASLPAMARALVGEFTCGEFTR
jgi:hypothetical protein